MQDHLDNQTICVIGLGYIGLPTAALFASHGKYVIGVDNNPSVVDTINAGKIHIIEPELDHLVAGVVASQHLTATSDIPLADVYVIAVPTPLQRPSQKPDIHYIQEVATSLAPKLQPGTLIILESTSPVGTTDKLSHWLANLRADLQFPHQTQTPEISICYCPERVLPGRILVELKENDRLIGGMTPSCTKRGLAFYQQFVSGQCVATQAKLAELAKLTENASRDVAIAFANELSLVCDELDVDVQALIQLANLHPRVNILKPGPGVGGHCIAVDPWFIIDSAPNVTDLMRTARRVNDSKPEYVLSKICQAASQFDKPTFACFGITFKKDVDDCRNSPALQITEALANAYPDNTLMVVEPNLKQLPDSLQDAAELVSFDKAYQCADVLILLVDHKQFRNQPVGRGHHQVIIDVQGIWHDDKVLSEST